MGPLIIFSGKNCNRGHPASELGFTGHREERAQKVKRLKITEIGAEIKHLAQRRMPKGGEDKNSINTLTWSPFPDPLQVHILQDNPGLILTVSRASTEFHPSYFSGIQAGFSKQHCSYKSKAYSMPKEEQ